MSYSVRIERLDDDGCPSGPIRWLTTASEGEAIQAMRKAIGQNRMSPYVNQFSVYGPGNQLLWSYSSEAATEPLLQPTA